ncbi:MAG: SurA N-terminal domain-containing protein [Paludibacteraceae bacterium]|nr:SurA N-terminal domain-containing protein [Paludibacteraceae bacterium]MBQ6764571.1 SurA N-terminal domain-containing protein [Paludibacteraceae bacterium]
MASLQKIRNHGALLIAIVGLAMLAFILGDFLNSGSSFFNRSRENVGVIEGQKIHYTEYEAAKEQLTEVYKIETGRSDFDEDTHTQIRNQVWNMMMMDYTLRAQAKAIGMDITADELSELCIGDNVHQIIRSRRAFMDENGQFSRDAVVNLLQAINQEGEDAEQNANLKQAKDYWMYWEKAVRISYMQEKYTALLQHLFKANSLDAEYAFNGRQNGVSAEYVMQPYYAVADSLVKVNDNDIRKLYKQHKQQYKQTPNRAIEYVAFDIKPSEDDFKAAQELLAGLQEEFKTAEDVSLVVNTNSDIMYDGRDYSEETVPAQYKDFAFAKGAKAGDCTEILFENNTYSMARLMQTGYSLPDSVELKAIVEGGEDQELGWFKATDLPKNIAEPAFAGKRGTRFTVAQGMGEQTYEVMEVGKATPKVKLAILAREVTPSSKTYSVIYNQAKQFIVANNSAEALEAAAQEAGLTVVPQYNLTETTDKVGQLKSSRPIVRWAFEAKEGQVSDVFECGQQFIVAALTEVNDGEYRPLDAVRAELTYEATNNAKAEYIKKQLKGVTTLEAAAEALNQKVQNVERVSLSDSRFGNAGMEPAVIGKVLAIGENEVSEPVQGKTGVFMVKRGAANNAAESAFNAESEKAQLASRFSYLPYQALQIVEDKAEVTDNRANFQ